MLILAGQAELAEAGGQVWGTGGWDPPEVREARDWLCLGRFCGWDVRVGADATMPASRFVIVAGERPPERDAGLLGARLEAEPLLVLARAPEEGSAWARLAGSHAGPPVEGRVLTLCGSDETAGDSASTWCCSAPLTASALRLDDAAAAVTMEGRPIASVRRVGRGVVLALGLAPSAARDADGSATALLRELLMSFAPAPVACLDWSGTLVLRMDDPGSSESAYRDGWRYPKLGRGAWRSIGDELRCRSARLSAAYVPAFVDDGDVARGRLEVADRPAARRSGALHPSRAVRYRAHDLTWDGVAEHAGLVEQQELGTIDVQLHGHTHLHPDRAAWAAAPDRYSSARWYRDLVVDADRLPDDEHPLGRGAAEIEAAFGRTPRAVICPGDEWTTDSLMRALGLGLDLVSSYYLALRDRDRWVWCQHVCAPYLDSADARWFAAELPVIGYFHDMEVSTRGGRWLTEQLDAWEVAGATRILGLADVAAALDLRLSFDGRRIELGPGGRTCPLPVRINKPTPD